MSSKEEEEGGANVIEATLEKTFEDLGRSVARYPLAFIGFSLALTTIFSLGTLALKDESRPDKQWVPEGSPALFHADYVSETWPSEQRFDLWIATCADIDGEPDPNCNLFTARHMQALFAVHNEIMDVVVDGDTIASEQSGDYPDADFSQYSGDWTFEGGQNQDLAGIRVERQWMAEPPAMHECDGGGGCCFESLRRTCDCTQTADQCVSDDPIPEYGSTCFKFGPFCAHQNILDVFAPSVAMFAPTAAYADHVANLTDAMVLEDINSWNNVHLQKHGCYDMDGTIPLADGGEPYAHHCVCDETSEHDGGVIGYCSQETCEAGLGSAPSVVADSFKKRIWMAGCSSCNCESWDAAHPNASVSPITLPSCRASPAPAL